MYCVWQGGSSNGAGLKGGRPLSAMGGGPNKAFHHIQIDVEDMKWWPINKNSKKILCSFFFCSFSDWCHRLNLVFSILLQLNLEGEMPRNEIFKMH